MEINHESLKINNAMKKLKTIDVPNTNKLEIFIFPITSNEFDYIGATNQLLESVVDFALSRKTKSYIGHNKHVTLSKKAREKFKDWKTNKGELGEFLLFCFLEGHLGAPKILSKLELKTSNQMYVHGADGLHYLKLDNGDFQLIFGESKLYKSITSGLHDAFQSISDFKKSINDKGESTSGIHFERSLISSNLEQVAFTDKEKEFLSSIIYPSQDENMFNVDNAFGIFIGYEMDYEMQRRTLSNSEFREYINDTVIKTVEDRLEKIREYIDKFNLYGHTFYIYLLPFSQLDETREVMLKELIG